MTPEYSALPRAVLFDMDGTLVDSTEMWFRAPDELVRQLGYEPKPSLYESTFPLGTMEIARFIHDDYHTRQSVEEVLSCLDARLYRYYAQEATLKRGGEALVRRLKATGVKLALTTATMERYARPALQCTGVDDLFDLVLTTDRAGCTKRDPEFFKTALRLLDVQPHEAWLFEDAAYSIRTARALGLHTCGVADPGAEFDQPAVREAADCFLESLADWRKLPFADKL